MPFFRRTPKRTPGYQSPHILNLVAGSGESLLVIACLVLSVQAFVKANFVVRNLPIFWRLNIVDVNTGVTALIAVLGLVALKNQLAMSTRPILSYSGDLMDAGATPADAQLPTTPTRWQTRIRNLGTGPARIVRVSYQVQFDGDAEQHFDEFEDLQRYLTRSVAIPPEDFKVTNISSGATIGSSESVTLFECSPRFAARVKRLDAHVRFQGQMGDSFTKSIFCIPRTGIQFSSIVR